MRPTLEIRDHKPSLQQSLELILTSCLTKVEANKQSHDASNKANKSNEVELGKLVPNWAFMMGIKVEESKENNCCNTASGPGDGCQCAR